MHETIDIIIKTINDKYYWRIRLNLINLLRADGTYLDKLYNVKNLSKIYGKNNIETYELKNGDHSLEINNTVEDIKQLGKIIQKINKFIQKVCYEKI